MYVKQRLGMHGANHEYMYPGEEMPHHPHAYGEVPMHPHHLPSRRASFAGFPQQRSDSYYHPTMNHPHQGGEMPSHQPSRRSSMMGERQAHLYMLQQQVQSQKERLEMEMDVDNAGDTITVLVVAQRKPACTVSTRNRGLFQSWKNK